MDWIGTGTAATYWNRRGGQGNVPPPDLYVRYGLPGGVADPAVFAAHIAAVLGYWRELGTTRTYAPLRPGPDHGARRARPERRLTLRVSPSATRTPARSPWSGYHAAGGHRSRAPPTPGRPR